jgi:hypothetical protein
MEKVVFVLTQEMCHVTNLLSDCSMIEDESNKKCNAYCHVLNNISFLMKGKLVRAISVM